MKRLVLWFSATALLGILVSTVPARVYTRINPERIDETSTPTDFEKEFVEQFSDRIKWLETIAYAALGGIVGLRWSQEKLITHPSIAISSGCLVVSLFNGYSAHDQVLQALKTNTPMLLSGAVSRLTAICQFWFLAIAVALLASRLLSAPRTTHRKALCVLLLVGCLADATHASPTVLPADVNVQACVSDWVRTRFNRTASAEELALFERIVVGTAKAKRIDLNQQNRCDFSASVLDFVLHGSYTQNEDREYKHFLQLARSIDLGINNAGAGESAVVRTLLSLAEIWHNPRGVLLVASSHSGDEVYVDDQRVGLTPFTCALAPGQHELRVRRNGTVVDSETIEVRDGIRLERKIN